MKVLQLDMGQVLLLKETLECNLEGLREALDSYGEDVEKDLRSEYTEIENLLVMLG